jgi:hypothetical protein
MYRRSFSILLLTFLTVLQAAQGVFTGGALCREETGAVTLEWARDGQCESAVAIEATENESESAASDHCGPCFDIPLPSETSLRSVTHSSDALPFGLSQISAWSVPFSSELVALENSFARPAHPSGPGSLATAQLGAVRLLI